MTNEQLISTREIAATPAEIFAVLSDPTQHQHTEPGDWVRDALDGAPIQQVGQTFGIEMFHESAGGRYDMHNLVTELEQDRTLEWEPGQLDGDGNLGTGGWRWRYDLTPVEGGTRVTLTYDWSRAPDELRRHIGLPPFGAEFLDQSLAALERHAVGQTAEPRR